MINMKHNQKNVNARRKRLAALLVRGNNHRPSTIAAFPHSIIYQSEVEYMFRCILERRTEETGGQLFGHWTDNGVPVIQYVIGPGPAANHRVDFFNQDITYLIKIGKLLKERYGLHHIGEWHSHHQLGLDHPSRYDVQTMTTSIREQKLGHFLLCIGTCGSDGTASVRGFYCDEKRCQSLDWDVIPVGSPVRKDADVALADSLIHPSYPHNNDKRNG